ncbi:MAG TPA: hypothetical protein VF039_05475 [Longimicrobiales bacterium]
MRARRLNLVALVALACGGCLRESTIEPVRETVMVHSVMRVGSTSIAVALGRVSRTGVSSGIGDAAVWLQRDGVEIPLDNLGVAGVCFGDEPAPAGARCYAASHLPAIEPGEALGLRIELADGTRIVGSTTTPAAPVIESPAAGADLTVTFVKEVHGNSGGYSLDNAPIEVRWSGTDSDPADVLIHVDRLFDDGSEIDCSEFFSFGESVHARSPAHVDAPVHCSSSAADPLWDSAYVTLHVAGFDRNALDYIAATDETVGVIIDGASPGLDVVDGDVLLSGVFGSVAVATAPLTLRTELVTISGSRASGAPARAAAAHGSGSRPRSSRRRPARSAPRSR